MTEKCAHCLQPRIGYGGFEGGRCCHPDIGMDCYRLATVYRHPTPCRPCADAALLLRNQLRDLSGDAYWQKPYRLTAGDIAMAGAVHLATPDPFDYLKDLDDDTD